MPLQIISADFNVNEGKAGAGLRVDAILIRGFMHERVSFPLQSAENNGTGD
jgi:hypothetical protein